MKLFAVLCVVLSLCYACEAKCNFPPSLWCSSYKIAEECQVSAQCDLWRSTQHQAPLVNFTLYYESLCPDCRQFISHMLHDTYQKVGHIMNLTLVPYGNARERREGNKWVFDCQHGKQECIGNLLETCAIRLVNNMPRVFGFIHCMEKSIDLPLDAAKHCAKSFTAIPLEKVLACYNGTQGNEFEHHMATITAALQPQHQYVPWVTLNGRHTEEIQKQSEKNLLKVICDAYTGTKPQACEDKALRCWK